MARTFVVLNPVAGSVRVAKVYTALRKYLPAGSYEVYETTGQEDLPTLVRRRVEQGCDTVIAIGGDGTVGAVAGGLVGTQARLGIVPAGTGNVLAHDAGIPDRMEEALNLIAEGANSLQLDAMQLGERYAFLNVSLGFSVEMLRGADPARKRKLGRLAYIGSALKHLAAVGVHTVHLSVDGVPHSLRASEVLVTNCPSLGAPELSLSGEVYLDDGRIEVVTFRARHLIDYVFVLLDLLLWRKHRRRNVRTFQVFSQVTIETSGPMRVQADGDLLDQGTPVCIRVVPGVVRLIVPARLTHAALGRRASQKERA